MPRLIEIRASHATLGDVARAGQAATKAPLTLLFSEVANASSEVRAAIGALESSGQWRPNDLYPIYGTVRPVLAQISPDSTVVVVSGRVDVELLSKMEDFINATEGTHRALKNKVKPRSILDFESAGPVPDYIKNSYRAHLTSSSGNS